MKQNRSSPFKCSKTGKPCAVSSQVLSPAATSIRIVFLFFVFYSVGPAWKRVGVKFLSALCWKGPYTLRWLLMLPTAPRLLKRSHFESRLLRSVFLWDRHSIVTQKQRLLSLQCLFLQNVLLYNTWWHLIFVVCLFYSVTHVKFRHRWYGIL